MIEMFVPSNIKNYYIRPQYILGLDITKSYVYGSLLYYKGREISIEKTFEEIIDQTSTQPYVVRAAQAVSKIVAQAPHAFIVSSLPSGLAACKELTFPFIDQEKISLIVNFEIEPYLPFALSDCVIDFIITRQQKEPSQTTVLVAAVQKKFIAEHVEIFKQANVPLDKLSLDLFDLYSLYKAIPQSFDSASASLRMTGGGATNKTARPDPGFVETSPDGLSPARRSSPSEGREGFERSPKSPAPGPVVLIDLDYQTTRAALIINNELKTVRTLNKGIAHLAKSVAQDSAITTTQALEELLRFGVENHEKKELQQRMQKYLQPYLQDIKLTLQSFSSLIPGGQPISNIILLGMGSELHEITKIFIDQLNIPCQLFEIGSLAHIPHVSIQPGLHISRAHLVSLGAAYQEETSTHFNLLKNDFALPTARTMQTNLFLSLGLVGLTLLALIGGGIFSRYRLGSEVTRLEQDVIKNLRQLDLSTQKSFTKAINEAEEKVTKEEQLWFAFSRQQRFSFLQTLQNLSTAIDRRSLGLNLKKMVLTNQDVTLEGEVRGFEELRTLEKELKKANMFMQIPPLQDLKFNEKLILKKNGDLHAGV